MGKKERISSEAESLAKQDDIWEVVQARNHRFTVDDLWAALAERAAEWEAIRQSKEAADAETAEEIEDAEAMTA